PAGKSETPAAHRADRAARARRRELPGGSRRIGDVAQAVFRRPRESGAGGARIAETACRDTDAGPEAGPDAEPRGAARPARRTGPRTRPRERGESPGAVGFRSVNKP